MKNIAILIIFLIMIILTSSLSANRYWPSVTLTDWSISINNGVVYISSPQMASHCNYSRAQINLDGTELNKSQYAFVLSAKARNKKLRYVIDNTHTTCVITGLGEV